MVSKETFTTIWNRLLLFLSSIRTIELKNKWQIKNSDEKNFIFLLEFFIFIVFSPMFLLKKLLCFYSPMFLFSFTFSWGVFGDCWAQNLRVCFLFSLQTYLFLRFNDFQSSKSCLFRFGVRLPEICFQKLINFGLLSQTYIKIKELDYLLKHQQLLFDYIQQIQLTW